ncbi:electron transfer flavoprotein subunit beta [Halomonas sp. DN3]|uniref:electron transfer flavoprotein subunit beta n=1 Tax=Halomonas sp. DN3 TaxID=2953657 RepID=UPI00209D2FEE|nr:electron transfer flavoprotein subunit beta [Halomonas sp. DN3]USZ50679.1 electron transfer flavoprotein subunit beta [Halomonas sp. DN3]
MLPESSSPHGEAKIGASADANGGVKNKAKASSADATYPQASAITSLRLDVLLSVGRHRLTGRAQRADGDARALEMALSLRQALQTKKTTPPEVELIPWHLGPEDDDTEAALRGYLGMGLDVIRWIKAPAAADAMAPLRASLTSPSAEDAYHRQARLALCGMRAEQGEGTGMLPMVLAEQLGWAWVPGVVALERIEAIEGRHRHAEDGEPGKVNDCEETALFRAIVLQALPQGQRRRLAVTLPAILGVDSAAPAARQSAFGPAQRGQLRLVESGEELVLDPAVEQWPLIPARARPKRLKIVTATSARDRFKAAASKAESGGGRVLADVSAEEGATAILSMLEAEGVLPTGGARYDQQGSPQGDGR